MQKGMLTHNHSGAWNLDINGNFSTFAGWILPIDAELLLVADDVNTVRPATVFPHRVGLDAVTGYLEDGMLSWNLAGLPTEHVAQISPQELNRLMQSGSGIVLVDARFSEEFERINIRAAKNIPAPDLRRRYSELPKDKQIVVICSAGMRSSLAASILQSKGFKNVRKVAGGMSGHTVACFAG